MHDHHRQHEPRETTTSAWCQRDVDHHDKDDIDQDQQNDNGDANVNAATADDDIINTTPTPPITLCWSSRHSNNNNNNSNNTDNSNSQKPKRLMCSRCHRPTPAACICDSLPDIPIRLNRTRILVLQHPHELKRKNRSVPLLQLVLDETCFQVAVGRKLGPTIPFYQDIIQDESQPLLLLYPGPNAMSLEQAMEQLHCSTTQQLQEQEKSCKVDDVEGCDTTTTCRNSNKIVNVLVLDGTWKYTKEMDRANTYPDRMLRVQWSPKTNNNNHNNDNNKDSAPQPPQHLFGSIRTPPSPNHLSTAECIAWLICCLEHGDSPPQRQHDDDSTTTTKSTNMASFSTGTTLSSFNSALYEQLLKPLNCMVSKWNSHRDNHNQNHDDDVTQPTSKSADSSATERAAPFTVAATALHEKAFHPKRRLEVDSETTNDGSRMMLPPRKGARRS
ncbi:hypothetical protein MHU86_9981 [Fragilaria crotonensis]|nr:hypothetical protein MHU86_9981 [Fragilaria crotonensis]